MVNFARPLPYDNFYLIEALQECTQLVLSCDNLGEQDNSLFHLRNYISYIKDCERAIYTNFYRKLAEIIHEIRGPVPGPTTHNIPFLRRHFFQTAGISSQEFESMTKQPFFVFIDVTNSKTYSNSPPIMKVKFKVATVAALIHLRVRPERTQSAQTDPPPAAVNPINVQPPPSPRPPMVHLQQPQPLINHKGIIHNNKQTTHGLGHSTYC
uniref:NR LBD domain-containing protein n=1 Tax=Strongyloides papillosus TaxID=174720 RepID=A0A0N5BEE1_STREA